MTSHSHLLEVDQETELVNHEAALLSLMQLVYTTFRNNIDKCVLICNVTNQVIWNYWGRLDRYPYQVDYETTAEGHRFLRAYKYHAWDALQKKFVWQPEVNVLRDHFDKFQEKINLNFEWHKSEWRRKALVQVKRELEPIDHTTGKGAIENYNLKQLSQLANQLKSIK